MDGVVIITNPIVNVRLTSTISTFESKGKFNRGITIAELKGKLEMIVGASAASMELELFNVGDEFLQKLEDNDALLGSFPVDDDCRIHVIDRSGGLLGDLSDVSKVEKFELPDEEYDKRTNTVRSFMKKRAVGHYNEEEMKKKKAELAAQEEEQKGAAEAISVGSRCKVQVLGQPTKIGSVMFVGTTDFKPGYWVGVKYDEPLGKNDGSVNGKRYFECPNQYGAFVKPLSVTVGDFPEEDYGLDEM
ncbi:tubulin-folding cofactor B [Periophthalmus magnuspinnatus]|uniref:CAP-Gly domain-containing protein n=1 Tax=Periophthalmus magnuspinnatus TaxID=409849 RepID=A0A3B4AKS8_9GOBI|nr:tubulin-folding cofactor B [Periophthalmus magnuspinnatus]XP_033832386.1 tubulin-folding cofactor B [Periophthalmus magnuspinnatus]